MPRAAMKKDPTRAQARRPRTENGRLLPKIVPLRGSLHAEWKRCGKPSCHCAAGARHGPYFYRHERVRRRQRKVYVRPDQVEAVRASIGAWKERHPPARSVRRELAELRRLLRLLDADGGWPDAAA